MKASILDRSDNLDASIEVARHPVGGSEIQLLLAVVGEIEDARMLQKAADDADDSDAIADPWYSRSKAADAAHDQVDVDSSLRGIVEMLDDVRIDQRIHFGDNARWFPRSGQLRFPVHHLGESRAHVARCYEQVSEKILTREAGQRIE